MPMYAHCFTSRCFLAGFVAVLPAFLLAACGDSSDEAALLTAEAAAVPKANSTAALTTALATGGYYFSGCTAYTGYYVTDNHSTYYVSGSYDGYYGWSNAAAYITVQEIRPNGTADVQLDTLSGTLQNSTFWGYKGTLGEAPLQVEVTQFLGRDHFHTTTYRTEPKQVFSDGSWSQKTSVIEFQNDRRCVYGPL